MQNFSYQTHIRRLEKLKLFYVEIPYEALVLFQKEGQKSIYNQRFMISINGCNPWHGGVVSLGNNTGYIAVKTQLLKKNQLHLDDLVSVVLIEDTSEYGMEFPIELEEFLKQDDEANERFLALPIGKRRYIIYTILQVKSPNKRLERTFTLLTNLKRLPKGNEAFAGILGKTNF